MTAGHISDLVRGCRADRSGRAIQSTETRKRAEFAIMQGDNSIGILDKTELAEFRSADQN
jgi:hypothetical protein